MSATISNQQQFLSRKQLAKRWGMHPESIKRRTAKGELTAYLLGSAIRYKLADIELIESESKSKSKSA